MKVLLITLCLFCISSFAQDAQVEPKDTAEALAYDFANYKLRLYKLSADRNLIREERVKRRMKMPARYMGIGLHSLMLLDQEFSTDFNEADKFMETLPGVSMGVQLNVIDFKIRLGKKSKGNVGLVSGLGFNFNYYRLRNKSQYIATIGDSITSAAIATSSSYKRLTFRVFDIHMPLMLEIAPILKPYRIAFGAEFSYVIHSSLFAVSTQNGEKSKIKRKDEFNINPIGFSPMIEIGFMDFTIYSMFNIASFFEAKKNPELNSMAIGFRLNF